MEWVKLEHTDKDGFAKVLIPQILCFQSFGIVLRMTCHKDLSALVVHNRINAGLF